tara:strand:+ start:5254 stop:5841 length:588 start_codon:yes stop_codon:yes gene_type:complete
LTKDGFEVYRMYLALQRHFSTDYDYFEYNGKVKVSTDAYSKRNDLYAFEKLTHIIKKEDREDFFVSHFLDNPKEWIRNMSKQKLDEYKAVYRNFPIKFQEQLYYLQINGPAEMIKAVPDKIPHIHNSCINGSVSLETICVLDDIFPFLETHEQVVKVPFVWPDHINKIKKYKPFVKKKVQDNFINIVDIARNVLL